MPYVRYEEVFQASQAKHRQILQLKQESFEKPLALLLPQIVQGEGEFGYPPGLSFGTPEVSSQHSVERPLMRFLPPIDIVHRL